MIPQIFHQHIDGRRDAFDRRTGLMRLQHDIRQGKQALGYPWLGGEDIEPRAA